MVIKVQDAMAGVIERELAETVEKFYEKYSGDPADHAIEIAKRIMSEVFVSN